MADTLPAQPWMTDTATGRVMDALEAAGGPGCARFVGGCVRNALLGAPVRDIDIATALTPVEVTAALKAAGLKVIPTGIEHGTVTAVAGGKPFEITTLRRDVETDGRRAVVAFTSDWTEDALRRDFRVNALYADREGRLYDPTGGGLEDVRAGAIVFVGDAATRIAEDALRIIRYFRFLAWYGRGEPDPASYAACREGRALVDALSAERIGHELMTLLAAPDPRRAVAMMDAAVILARLAPMARDRKRFETLVELQRAHGLADDALLRLGALCPDDPDAGRDLAGRLRLSNAQRDRLVAALTFDPAISADLDAPGARRAIYRSRATAFADRVTLRWAGVAGDSPPAAWLALLKLADEWPRPQFPLNGHDVAKVGVPAGPATGALLREIEAWWIAQDFAGDRTTLARQLETAARRSR